jgi:hypothetical protein
MLRRVSAGGACRDFAHALGREAKRDESRPEGSQTPKVDITNLSRLITGVVVCRSGEA